jgi:hypothetical protein
VPLGNDQPGVAARLKARGACVVVSRHRLNSARLRKAVMLVLQAARYREAAQVLQRAIQKLDGRDRACRSHRTGAETPFDSAPSLISLVHPGISHGAASMHGELTSAQNFLREEHVI